MPVPTLALVDAFVGGLAVLLILIVLSSRTEPKLGERPVPDLVLACAEDRLVAARGAKGAPLREWPSEGHAPEGAAAALATLPPATVGDRLSVRVRLEAGADDLPCASRFTRAVQARNDETDALAEGAPTGLHLLVSLHLLEETVP